MHTIIYKKKALKALDKIPVAMAQRFRSAFKAIAMNDTSHLDIKPMEGLDGYRLRISDYRAIYEIDNGQLKIMVMTVGSRGDIYK